jgi:SNF2 family DNA or RNA helicase
MKSDAHTLHEEISKRYPCVLITGEMTFSERELAVIRAREIGACVVATIDSCNAGVNGLQYVADTVVFHALDYTPTKMAQAEGRAHRLGQEKPVTVVFMVMRDSADEFVRSAVIDKLDAWRATMGEDLTSDMRGAISEEQSEAAQKKVLAEIYAALEEA